MRLQLSFIITVFYATLMCGQCDFAIILSTQQEVDSFPINYASCIDSNLISFDLLGDDINDLSPLFGMRYASKLRVESSSLESLYGLDSLVSLRGGITINCPALKDCSSINKLETNSIRFYFTPEIKDLSCFQNIDSLGYLQTYNNGDLSSLNGRVKDGTHWPWLFILNNTYPNEISDLFSDDTDTVRWITIGSSKNTSFTDSKNIDHILSFAIIDSDFLSIPSTFNCKSIERLWIEDNNLDFIGDISGIENVEYLEKLRVVNFRNLSSINQILPNIKNIKSSLQLIGNADLESVGQIDWLEPPTENYYSDNLRLDIDNNSLLEMCDNYFICQSLKLFPELVRIQNNSELCNKDYLIENCDAILSDEVVEASDFAIYPNPLMDQVTITSDVVIDDIMWIDATGRGVNVTTAHSGVYNTADLETGVYLVKIKVGDRKIVKRVVKM